MACLSKPSFSRTDVLLLWKRESTQLYPWRGALQKLQKRHDIGGVEARRFRSLASRSGSHNIHLSTTRQIDGNWDGHHAVLEDELVSSGTHR